MRRRRIIIIIIIWGPPAVRTWSICFMFPIGSGSRPSIAHAVNSEAIQVHRHCGAAVPFGEAMKGSGKEEEIMVKMVEDNDVEMEMEGKEMMVDEWKEDERKGW